MMKKAKLLIFSLFIASCTKTVYLKPKPFEFQKFQAPEPIEIYILNEYVELYTGYIKAFRKTIELHNEQIDKYNKLQQQ